MSALRHRLSAAVVCLLLALFLAGCHGRSTAASSDGTKFYSLRGRVVAADPAKGELTLAHGAIPGFMEAMTMPYGLVNPSELSEMHPGDLITARVVVPANGPVRLDHLVVVGQSRPDTVPAVQYHVPTPGDAVPDFHFLDQSGTTEHLAQFRGKVVLLTFIYTRCPVADFCPRMSANFAAVDKALATDPALYARTHLLSVSFDPAYDTPAVLRSYGGAHTGRFTEEDFRHWSFAAPPASELPKVEQYFNVGVTGADPSTLTHSLSTVLIGPDGKVLAWYPSNTWQPAEVAQEMARAAVGK